MPLETIQVSALLPATPAKVYAAWLDGALHAAMTGGAATCDNRVGGEHTAWDGYISGRNLELVEGRRIVQSWRTTEFGEEDGDSRLEIRLESAQSGSRMVIVHSDIPQGEGIKYAQGWEEHYIAPMEAYFAKK